MEAIEESLATGRHLLLAAPTGVGKTAAALFPALRLALTSGRRLVFVTAKTLQQHLAVETLQAMQDGSWHSLQLRAKARMCAHREVICHEEFCPFLSDMWLRQAERGVLPTLLGFGPHLDPDRIFDVARAAEVCPFETSLALIGQATAVVCDYNYVFDPTIGLFGTAADGGLEDTFLVIDEAHNLVDRAREYYSPRLARSTVQAARRLLEGYRHQICRDLEDVLANLEELLASRVQRSLGHAIGVRPTELDAESLIEVRLGLDALLVPYFTFKRSVELWLARDPVMDVSLTLSRLVGLLGDGGKELVPLAERVAIPQPDEALRVFCLDAGRFTGELLASSAGTVAMSATLQPFEFYRDLLGFDPDRTDTLTLPSPFPREHRMIVTIDEVDTSYSQRGRWYGRIAELVAELAPPGRNALVLFPSYAFLNEVAGRLHLPDHVVEIQRGDHSEALRRDILARMRANHAPTVLLAVLGGVFAEGVDYPGEMLSEVVVVSPALPQVGPERELLKAYFQDRFERGFEYAYLVPGMTRVVQAAGRLIRAPEDRGVIALVCRRFTREPYVNLLPPDWLEDTAPGMGSSELTAAVREFYAQLPAATEASPAAQAQTQAGDRQPHPASQPRAAARRRRNQLRCRSCAPSPPPSWPTSSSAPGRTPASAPTSTSTPSSTTRSSACSTASSPAPTCGPTTTSRPLGAVRAPVGPPRRADLRGQGERHGPCGPGARRRHGRRDPRRHHPRRRLPRPGHHRHGGQAGPVPPPHRQGLRPVVAGRGRPSRLDPPVGVGAAVRVGSGGMPLLQRQERIRRRSDIPVAKLVAGHGWAGDLEP